MTAVEVSQADGVATIRWRADGPVASLSRVLARDLDAALDRVATPSVRCVVLAGSGRTFIVGADVKELGALTPAQNAAYNRQLVDLANRVGAFPVPVIACLNGHAFGGGLELALACTIRVAAAGALLGLPEVKLGLIPGSGGLPRLMRTVAPGTAMRLLLTGDSLDAAEAHRIGLVDRVVPDGDDPLAAVQALAGAIASRAPLAVREALAAARLAQEQPLAQAIDEVHERVVALCAGHDVPEGIAAFLERREPRFTGA